MEMGDSSAASESQVVKIGLKFGQKTYFEDVGAGAQPKSGGGLSPGGGGGGSGGGGGGPQKKGKTEVGVQSQQPPRCQVEGCNLDLSDAKTYYSRHKVCGAHSKTPKVIVNGLEQRFCQQCSRFHQLPEFDQGKRSCRRRLAGHNERRRKPPTGTLLSSRYGSLSSSIFENDSRAGGFLMDFSTCSRARVQWPNPRPSSQVANNLPTAFEKFPPLPWQSNLDNPPPCVNPNVQPHPGGCLTGVSNSNRALSLLSNQSSGSRNQTLSHEYYVNPDAGPAAHMIQLAGGGDGVTTMGQFSSTTTSWGYDANETYLGLGQFPQSDYSGELGLGQQSGRRYDSSAEHIHWSL